MGFGPVGEVRMGETAVEAAGLDRYPVRRLPILVQEPAAGLVESVGVSEEVLTPPLHPLRLCLLSIHPQGSQAAEDPSLAS